MCARLYVLCMHCIVLAYDVCTYMTLSLATVHSSAEPSGQYKTKEWLERIIVLGLQSKPRRITMKDASGKPLMICSTALLLCVYQPFHVVCLHLPPHGA